MDLGKAHLGRLPNGVKDLFGEAAARQAWAERTLEATFAGWGYSDVVTPTIEYYDNLALGVDSQVRGMTYRFFDREGHTLALRPDITVQIARLAGTKLFGEPLPLRLCYIANVFRYGELQSGQQREFTQAGLELIGADTAEADAEVVTLSVVAFQALGLREFQVSLGQMAFFWALVAMGSPSPVGLARIQEAVNSKNLPALRQILREEGLNGEAGRALEALPSLCGGREVLAQARKLSPNQAAHIALDRLARVYDLLAVNGVADRVILDLGKVPGMDYYTGITFKGYARGLGFPLLSGGRYDDLIGRFGTALPAVGFGLEVERCLFALGETGRPLSLPPHLIVGGVWGAPVLALVQELREKGLRVEIDVLGREERALAAYAQERGARGTLISDGDGRLALVELGGRRAITRETLLAEATTWQS